MKIIKEAAKKRRPMTKDEVLLLVDLIAANPNITSKKTNAVCNKMKEAAWDALTVSFNSRSGLCMRSKCQLKAKWDNLKKTARKRAQTIRRQELKSDGEEPDFVPPDDILERVCNLMESRSTYEDTPVPFNSDGVGLKILETGSWKSLIFGDSILESSSDVSSQDKAEKENNTHFTENAQKENDIRNELNLTLIEYYKRKTEKVELETELLLRKLNELKQPKRSIN